MKATAALRFQHDLKHGKVYRLAVEGGTIEGPMPDGKGREAWLFTLEGNGHIILDPCPQHDGREPWPPSPDGPFKVSIEKGGLERVVMKDKGNTVLRTTPLALTLSIDPDPHPGRELPR